MFDLVITATAESDIEAAYTWWRDNRSAQQAARWLDSIYPAIERLCENPRLCSVAAEQEQFDGELRQLLFGIGRHPTHRVVFSISGSRVEVLRVRHVAQATL